MFSKLYHHLEEIKANTGRQQVNSEHAEALAQKISEQLGALNTSVLSLKDSLSSLNASVSSVYNPAADRETHRSRAVPIAGIVVGGLCLILAGLLTIYAYRFSAATDAARDRSTAVLHAYDDMGTRYQAVSTHAVNLEARTARLDSLVRQQAQTIVELKKLNIAAFRTMYYLQRDLTNYHQQLRSQAVEQTSIAH